MMSEIHRGADHGHPASDGERRAGIQAVQRIRHEQRHGLQFALK